MRSRPAWSLYAVQLVVLFVLFVVCGLPLMAIALRSVQGSDGPSLAAFGDVLRQSRQWSLLANSLVISLGSTALAVLIGVPTGLAIEFYRIPGRRLAMCLAAVPALVPPYIWCVAWLDVLGSNGLLTRIIWPSAPTNTFSVFTIGGVVFISALTYAPLASFGTIVSLRRIDQQLIDAARVSGKSFGVLAGIVAPLAMPGVATAALIIFAITLTGFAVPSLLQVNTYPVEIHAAAAMFDYAAAVAQAMPLLVLCACAAGIWCGYVYPRRAWLGGSQRSPGAQSPSGYGRAIAAVYAYVALSISVPLPLLVLLWRSFPLQTYWEVIGTARGELVFGSLVALATAALATAIAFSATAAFQRTSNFVFIATSILPFAASGTLIGLALISVWNRAGLFGAVYDSAGIVILACLARYLALSFAIGFAGRQRLSAGLFDAARVSGAPWWKTGLGVLLPLQTPFLALIFGLTFVLAFGEVDATVLVCPPGQTTAAVRLFTLMHYGPDSYVAALSILTVMLLLCVAGATALAYRYSRHVIARA